MDPRYPIGKFQQPLEVTSALRQQAIEIIAETPAKLRAAVAGLSRRSWTRHIVKAAGPFAKSFTTSLIAISMHTSAFALRSPKSSQRSSPMKKISGRNCRCKVRSSRNFLGASRCSS